MATSPKAINQHKRLAMGDTVKGFAKGGSIGLPPVMTKPSLKGGLPESPITRAKRDNGVPGMKSGGSTKKC